MSSRNVLKSVSTIIYHPSKNAMTSGKKDLNASPSKKVPAMTAGSKIDQKYGLKTFFEPEKVSLE